MSYCFYNILLTFLAILSPPYFLMRGLVQKQFRKELTERLGFFPTPPVQSPIWIHAASVGEVFCCIPLIKRIKKDFPNSEIVMTTMTRTGYETAKAQIPQVDAVLLFPIDHPLVIRRTIARIHPKLLLIAETELWPNLLRSCGKKGIPIILFNGRISQKSFRGYLFLKSLFKGCLESVSAFLMQTEEDRARIIEIGASSEKTKVVGNLKFDQSFPMVSQEWVLQTAQSLGYLGNEKIFIAGSTHTGEEEILISLFKELRKIDPHLVLLLAPRHIDRMGEVERILKRETIPWRKRTSFPVDQGLSDHRKNEVPSVILLDTMGELMSLYSLGTLVFIGGSLIPMGGHNPLEPLFFKKCVLFGPYMFNFLEVSRGLVEEGGAIQVTGKEDLFLHLKRLLSDERARKEMGERGFQFLQQHRGATERVFEEIKPFLTDIADLKLADELANRPTPI
ncbi:MAG: 3-deoxy-D-manno-octulosonic acid transferase [Thermodesulfobacteriota bacterium]